MAISDVKKVYQDIINDVCSTVREALSEEGYDDHTLQELKTLWLTKLENSRALEPIPVSIVDQATNREFRRTNPGETGNISFLNNKNINKSGTPIICERLHPASTAAVSALGTTYAATAAQNPSLLSIASSNSTSFSRPAFPIRPTNATNITTNTMKASGQLDGSNDEIVSSNTIKKNKISKKKPKSIEICFQIDGTGPPVGDDEDEDEESDGEGNEVGDGLDDDDDDEDGNEEGKEDPKPLCTDDDASDDESAPLLFDTDNVVVCQYDKVSRIKTKWRFMLKSGVMNIEGRDYVFSKATGDADW